MVSLPGLGCHRQLFPHYWGSTQKIAAVLVWDGKHLLGSNLHGHTVPDGGSPGQVAAWVRVIGGHRVLRTHHLCGELGASSGRGTAGWPGWPGGEAGLEVVWAEAGDRVDSQLARGSHELAGRAQGGGVPARAGRCQDVEVPWVGVVCLRVLKQLSSRASLSMQ